MRSIRPETSQRLIWFAVACGLVVGCSGDGGAPTAPGASGPASYRLALPDGDTLRGKAGEAIRSGTSVRVMDGRGNPVEGVQIAWRVITGGGQITRAVSQTDGAGIASTSWVLGPELTTVQTLQLRANGGDSLALYALAELPFGAGVSAETTLVAVDTVGAYVRSPLRVTVSLPDGRPVSGAPIVFLVTRGGGEVSTESATTDSVGTVATSWHLGDSAGTQEVTATVRASGGQLGKGHIFRATAVPGAPADIIVIQDTLRFTALFDTLSPAAVVHDRAGNPVDAQIDWTSLTPSVVSGIGEIGIVALGNGTGQAVAQSGAASRSVSVSVLQVPAGVRQSTDSVGLHYIGAIAHVGAEVIDWRGWPIAGLSTSWRTLAAGAASVDSNGTVTAEATGIGRAVAEYQGFADTTLVAVDQVPASIDVSPTVDTVGLDEQRTPAIAVHDSGGTLIPGSAIQVSVSDTGVIGVGAGGALSAKLPGVATLTYVAGAASVSVRRVVEGVAILWDGQRLLTPGALSGHPSWTITNGRVRISWSTALLERGSVYMEVRLGDSWYPATSAYGDWLYIASSIITEPTEIELVEDSPDLIGLRFRYDDHWFLPQSMGFDSAYVAQPYPFARTVWLRKNDNGYYSWVDLFSDLNTRRVEHETGFGGVWGAATIRTGHLTIRTDTLQKTVTYNGNPGTIVSGSLVDAADFQLDGDPVRRVLVPLPEAPFISPVFPGWGYGSVYRYEGRADSFGVYMYATGAGSGPPAPTICRDAWGNAPFPLHAVSDADFATCGPAGP
jgi:hypothetical protein